MITRRTVLKGAGVAVGLPWLQAMAPSPAPIRLAALYMPNGVHPGHWTPGPDFKLSRILEPLEPLKSEILVLTGLTNKAAHTGDGHYVKAAGFLTGTTITKTTGSDVASNGVSMDQIAAQRLGAFTRLPSIELSIEPPRTTVDKNVGYTQLYGGHISWSTPTTPTAREINPRLAFNRLFRDEGTGGPTADDRSILDRARADAKKLEGRLGAEDRRKLDEYLESIRAIERRIEFDEKRRAQALDPKLREAIAGLDKRLKSEYLYGGEGGTRGLQLDHAEHVALMLDILLLAFRCDATRVATLMFGRAVSSVNFSFVEGVHDSFHELSHHQGNKEKMEQYARINRWHLAQVARLLEGMRAIPEGDGTLLDHSMVLFGSGLRDGNAHDPNNLPILLAGRAGGTLKTGRHLTYENGTPLCNLYVSMLRRAGAPVESFADGTGELPQLD